MEINQESNKGKVCQCHHHKAAPIAIIIIGIVVLLGAFNFFDFRTESILLGILAIFIGFTRFFERKCDCC